MNAHQHGHPVSSGLHPGLYALCGIASYYRIPSNPSFLMRELSLADDTTSSDMLIRGAALLGLDGKVIRKSSLADPSSLPFPVIFLFDDGTIALFGGPWAQGTWRLIDPVSRKESELTSAELAERGGVDVVVVRRKLLGPGVEPENFSLHFFLKAIKKYKRPLVQILLASCIVQIFALITPLFFQAVIDKVLVHYSTSTLHVLIIGIIIVILFDTILQYIRTYSLNHTSNRIDVELSRTVFSHLLRLPMSYFESRAAGQTVARVRELESIRAFLTGPALTAVLDVVFTGLFLAVMFFYSTVLSLVVLATIPLYVLTAILIRPVLQQSIAQKFYRGALCQQLLVESIIGIQTVKASAVENQILLEWDARLAGYVQTSFGASQVSALGSGIIQAISRLGSAAVLWLGAYAVMEGSLTVGGLVAFNIIATQISQPIIRLSQLWQDFQQVKVSIARLGDVLNAQPEPGSRAAVSLAPPRGLIQFRDVTFRYNPTGPDVLRNISFDVAPGQVVGIIGTSGSGKSTLAKLMQRFAIPQGGEILIDGHNLAHVDPAWIRRNTGVVLQESALFNRSVHDNIALANPAVARERVIAVAQLSGADEFIRRMPQGYDTIIEERGVNLSGGQKQRIAIARALIANPKILIFDEATSSLDYESEQLIRTNMQRIAFGRTVIIIAHRLTTVMNCDVIFGLKDGVIVEQGTHTDLIARPHGLYASLWSRQFGKPSR